MGVGDGAVAARALGMFRSSAVDVDVADSCRRDGGGGLGRGRSGLDPPGRGEKLPGVPVDLDGCMG